MAVTFSAANEIDRITMNATAGNVTKVTFDEKTRVVYIQGFDAAGTSATVCKYALSGTDGGAIGTNFMTIPEGVKVGIPLGLKDRVLGGYSIYIASDVNSGIVEVEASSVPLL